MYEKAKIRLHRGYDHIMNFMKARKESRRHQRKMEIGARARRIKISCSLEFNGGSLLRNHAAMKKAYRSSRQGQGGYILRRTGVLSLADNILSILISKPGIGSDFFCPETLKWS